MRLNAMAAALAALFLAAAPASAQPHRGPDIAAQRAAMERLAPLLGRWEGVANVTFPQPATVHQTELVETEFDGLLILVRGTGYASADHSGAPVFQAFGVISYNDMAGRYEFRTYANGYAATATGEFLDDGAFQWSIDAGGSVRMRFTIRFDATTWRETGEMSYDGGGAWTRTIELNLTRVS